MNIKGNEIPMNYRETYAMPPKGHTLYQAYRPKELALNLIRKTIQFNQENEPFYDYLFKKAQTQEERRIIRAISYDKIKHHQVFKQIYYDLTGHQITMSSNTKFHKPSSYLLGLSRAYFRDLDDSERYKAIREDMQNQHYINIINELICDNLIHLCKYNYIFAKHRRSKSKSKEINNITNSSNFNTKESREFTREELARYTGSNGTPAYVAVDNIIYDVSLEKTWGGASHFGLEAGKDLTTQYNSCHGMSQILSKLPKVGTLKANSV